MIGNEIEILRLLESLRNGVLNTLFKYLSMLGEGTVIFVVIALFYFIFNKEFAYVLLYNFSSSHVINGIVKNFARVPRPFNVENPITCVYPDTATGYSFPSGHSQIIATSTTTFALKFKKAWIWIISIILMLLIGFSRIYLGCHYLSDVVVGLLLGILWAIIGTKLIGRFGIKPVMLVSIVVGFPFAVYFLLCKDPYFADFYKTYGIVVCGYLAICFENKFVNFKIEGPIWRRIVRCAITLVIALALIKGLKALFALFINDNAILLMVFSFLRYGLLCFITLGLMPWVYKKLKL